MGAATDGDDLSTMNPTGRFSDRVGDYTKFRPTYPWAIVEAVLEGLGPPGAVRVADIGAGTGIFTRLVAQRGARVMAVEPNAEMRRAGEAEGDAGGRIEWREGTAEATGLEAASVDAVVCAQAFHWFRAAEALAEFARVLRRSPPGGRLALVWNGRDRTDPFTRGYTEAIVAIGGESRVETHRFDPGVVDRQGSFAEGRVVTAEHEQALDLAGLLGRALSASYVPKAGPGHERVMASLRELFARHERGGAVRMRYRCEAYVWRRV